MMFIRARFLFNFKIRIRLIEYIIHIRYTCVPKEEKNQHERDTADAAQENSQM